MDHMYHFDTPRLPIDAGIIQFFESFYRVSDTPDAHDVYINHFTPDATFILASKVSNGIIEIKSTREGMWAHVKSRKHTVEKLFPFGPNSQEVMLYGSVEYDLKNGKHVDVDWAARAVLIQSEDDGKWRMSFYQVYMDTAPATDA